MSISLQDKIRLTYRQLYQKQQKRVFAFITRPRWRYRNETKKKRWPDWEVL